MGEKTVEVKVRELQFLATEVHKNHVPKFPDCSDRLCTVLWFMLPDDLDEWTP
jgi:hypothetical protein